MFYNYDQNCCLSQCVTVCQCQTLALLVILSEYFYNSDSFKTTGRVIVSRTYVSGAAPVPPPNFAPPAQPPPPQTYPPPDGAYPPPSGTYPPPGGAFPSTSQPFASAAADSTSAPNNNFASPFGTCTVISVMMSKFSTFLSIYKLCHSILYYIHDLFS